MTACRVLGCLVAAAAAGGCAAPPVPRTAPTAGAPPFRDVPAAGLVEVGSVRVDPVNCCVLATGWVNQTAGLVELLACGPGGKTHESVLVLDVRPIDLQAALLLLGLRPGTPPRALGVGAPGGPAVDVWVEWRQGGALHRTRAERLIIDKRTGQTLPATPWVFTDATVDGEFMAGRDESLAATWWDPWALLNLPLACGADDDLLFVNESALPPEGTAVYVRFHPVVD